MEVNWILSATYMLPSAVILLSLSEQNVFNHTIGMIHLNLSSNFLEHIHAYVLQVADHIDLSNNRLHHIPEPPTSESQFTQEQHMQCGM